MYFVRSFAHIRAHDTCVKYVHIYVHTLRAAEKSFFGSLGIVVCENFDSSCRIYASNPQIMFDCWWEPD